MFVYFNRLGQIKEVISNGPARVGNNLVNKIYCYFENENFDSLWFALEKSNGVVVGDRIVTAVVETTIQQLIPDEVALQDFQYFNPYLVYKFYIISLSSEDLDQEGLTKVSVKAKSEIEPNVYQTNYQGMITFNVEDSVVQYDPDITQSQYDYLLALIGGAVTDYGFIELSNENVSGVLSYDNFDEVTKSVAFIKYGNELFVKTETTTSGIAFNLIDVNEKEFIGDNPSSIRISNKTIFINNDYSWIYQEYDYDTFSEIGIDSLLGTQEFSELETYNDGDLVIYVDRLYKCLTTHTGAWNSEHFELTDFKTLITGFMTNPIQAQGDLIVGSENGQPTRLPKGNIGYVLKVTGSGLGWAEDLGSNGMTNPMTTKGDIIYSLDSEGTPQRLGIGANGKVLKVVSGIPAWADETGGSEAENIGYIELSGTSGTLTAEEIVEAEKDFCIVKIGTNLYIKRSESDSSIVFERYNAYQTGQHIVVNNNSITITKSNGNWVLTTSSPVTYTTTAIQDMVAELFSSSETYAIGDLTIYNDKLYQCTSAHTGAWNSSNFTQVDLASLVGGSSDNLGYIELNTNNTTGTLTDTQFLEAQKDYCVIKKLISGSNYRWIKKREETATEIIFNDIKYTVSNNTINMTQALLTVTKSNKEWTYGVTSYDDSYNIQAIQDMIAPAFGYGVAYSVGDLVIYQGDLYKCIQNHSAGVWEASDFEATSVEELLADIGSGDMTNPMTTKGDIIVGGSSGSPARLGIGTAKQVLEVNDLGNDLQWGKPKVPQEVYYTGNQKYTLIDNKGNEIELTSVDFYRENQTTVKINSQEITIDQVDEGETLPQMNALDLLAKVQKGIYWHKIVLETGERGTKIYFNIFNNDSQSLTNPVNYGDLSELYTVLSSYTTVISATGYYNDSDNSIYGIVLGIEASNNNFYVRVQTPTDGTQKITMDTTYFILIDLVTKLL